MNTGSESRGLREALTEDYVCPETGELKPERRKFARVADEEVEHLFNGFHNAIGNADAYSAGYLRAMRDAFARYVRRAALAAPVDPPDLNSAYQGVTLPGGSEPPAVCHRCNGYGEITIDCDTCGGSGSYPSKPAPIDCVSAPLAAPAIQGHPPKPPEWWSDEQRALYAEWGERYWKPKP